jgi:hypothetical protein
MYQLAESDYPDSIALQKRLGHRTALATPLLREGNAIGAIVIRRNEVRSFSTDLESKSFSDYWKGTESIIEGNAHSGKRFSRINNQHSLGLSYSSELPNFIKTKNFALEVEFYYRMQGITSKAIITVSLELKDSLIFQQSVPVASDSAVNRWAIFRYRSLFPGNLPPNSVLSVTLKQNGKSAIDVDDYKISFNRTGRPSFLITGAG